MEYEVLPHTADLRIRARGRTLEELFSNSLRGMNAMLQPDVPVGGAPVEWQVRLAAPDTAALLVDFLAAALSQSHINGELYTDVEFDELSETLLRATLRGVNVPAFERDIKAVTYHGVEIKETDDGYEATVVYDI